MSNVGALVGIGILLISLVLLGTWPALLRLSTWKENERNISLCGIPISTMARHPCHAYIDYGISYVVSSLIPLSISLLIAKIGSNEKETTSFWIPRLAAVAMAGGTLLALGNMSMQWSTAVYGAPLTTVLALQASLTVVLGTSFNYYLQPELTAYPGRLAGGVVMFLLAIGVASRAQVWYHGQFRPKPHYVEIEISSTEHHVHRSDPHHDDNASGAVVPAASTGEEHVASASLEEALRHHDIRQGLVVALFGGFCFGFFSSAFNIAVNDPLGWDGNNGRGLGVASANFWFAVAFGLCSVLGNIILMAYPPVSHLSGFAVVPRSSMHEYVQGLSWRGWAARAGLLCAMANLLQFQGGKLAGFAAADLVQAFPLVATLWDVLLFGEFKQAQPRVLMALVLMYCTYLSGIVLLASSIAI